MAFTRKPGPAQSINLVGAIPDPAKIPVEISDRFGEFKTYQTEMDRWWDQFKTMLQRDIEQIRTQFAANQTTVSSWVSAIDTSLATIQTQIDELGGTPATGSIAAQILTLTEALNALTASLGLHVNASAAHGVISDIVGVNDAQTLNAKRIGTVTPGYGRFNPLQGVGRIAAGDTVTVGPGDYMVVAGPFTISGSLVIDGTFAAV
ncbi:MAG: hypothetical protein ABIW79_00285 [Gemmatimonas sp.]